MTMTMAPLEMKGVTRDWLTKTYKLRGLRRYNDRIHIINEDVAQHSFFVTLIVLKLYEVYDFNLAKALSMAITHDLPEIYVSDVTYKVKQDYPAVSEALKVAEKEVWAKHFPQWGHLAEDLEGNVSVESLIVKLADIISVLQFSDCEISLGNSQEDILNINNEVVFRIKQYEDKLVNNLR